MGEHIGFIGLGRMGGHMASRLLDAGHALTILDVNEAAIAPLIARGAQKAASAKGVADAAEIVMVSLPTPDIVKNAALGPNGIVEGGKVKIFIDLSTTGPRMAKILYDGFGAKGISSLDAPVSGGVAGAKNGTLALMVSGQKPAYDRAAPLLSNFGKLFFMGEVPGAGQTMKLVNNLMSAASLAITSEGMAMGQKAGLDPQQMIDVLNVSSGRNSATQDKWPKSVLPRSFDFGFANALSFKDVRLCLDEAEALGVPMVVGAAVRQMLSITQQTQGPDPDITHMAKVVEAWAGLDLDKKKS